MSVFETCTKVSFNCSLTGYSMSICKVGKSDGLLNEAGQVSCSKYKSSGVNLLHFYVLNPRTKWPPSTQ